MRYLAFATLALALGAVWAGPARADYTVGKVSADLAKAEPDARYWETVPSTELTLMAQPMVVPRPKQTTTAQLTVQAVHDGKRLALRLRWKDPGPNEAGRLGEASDAVAVEFPVGSGEVPPPVFMGTKDNPVHIFHWRAQYERDRDRGKPTMKDLYPNMAVDIYPMEFKDHGAAPRPGESERDVFSPGRAQGNPQSYSKTGVDEILAEGFSTSSVQEGHNSVARSKWADGMWTVVITRDLRSEGGSVLELGKKSFVGAAVWQGGELEVGSRKCVTMSWTPILISANAPGQP